MANNGEGGESDFQSYHNIKIECPEFNEESEHTKKQGSVAHSRGKK